MKKSIFVLFLSALLLMGLLSGCIRNYTKKDVHNYIRQELNLRDYHIIAGPKEKKSPEGYTDEWWTVSTNDYGFDDPITFHVINHTTYSLWASNYLMDDLEEEIFKRLSEEYRGNPNFRMTQSNDYFLSAGMIEAPLNERSDFEAIFPEIERFQEYVSKYPKLGEMSFRLQYIVGAGAKDYQTAALITNDDFTEDSYIRKQYDTPDDYLMEEYYTISFTSKTTLSELHNSLYSIGDSSYLNGAVYHYLADCLLYGALDRISEFTEDEISSLISLNNNLTEIRDEEQNVPVPHLVYAADSNYIPIGSFYKLLEYQNIPLKGDWMHYSFTGKDGNFYEFGYDLPYITEDNWYTYCIPVDDAVTMSGLHLDNGYPIYDLVIPAEIFDKFDIDTEDLAWEIDAALDGDIIEYDLTDEGFHIKGKALQFNRIEQRNEDRIREIEESIKRFAPGFYATIRHQAKSYDGISFRFDANEALSLSANQDAWNEMAALTVLNQILDNPESDVLSWSLEVEFIRQHNGGSDERIKYLLPEEFEDYRNASFLY